MKDKQISLKLSEDLHSKLELIAKSKEINISALIRMVLKEYVNNQ